MKAVMANVPDHILEWRRRSGADQGDEMWEGVLHMAPSPNRDHQDIEGWLESWLRRYWAEPKRCRVYHQINVAEPGTWPNNYRIPDLVLLTPARFEIDCNEYFDGGPDVAVEIHCPGDEAYEKLDFYAKLGVREVWIIDRDTKRLEILAAASGGFQTRGAVDQAWIQTAVTGIEMRSTENGGLEIRLVNRSDTAATLP